MLGRFSVNINNRPILHANGSAGSSDYSTDPDDYLYLTTYVEDQPPVAVLPADFVLADPDGHNLSRAEVTLSSRPNGENDVLSLNAQPARLTVSTQSLMPTGSFTLNILGVAPPATYQRVSTQPFS